MIIIKVFSFSLLFFILFSAPLYYLVPQRFIFFGNEKIMVKSADWKHFLPIRMMSARVSGVVMVTNDVVLFFDYSNLSYKFVGFIFSERMFKIGEDNIHIYYHKSTNGGNEVTKRN